MAQRKSQAWLTGVVNDASVPSALVLAESLKRSRTTRTIAVITTEDISLANRTKLRDAFDTVFYMEKMFTTETCVGLDGNSLGKEDIAKLYSFSLTFFDTIVFLSSETMVLENSDMLFDETNSSLNLLENYAAVTLEAALSTLIVKTNLSTGRIPINVFAKYSFTQETLLTDKTRVPIGHFVDIEKEQDIKTQMEGALQNPFIMIREKKMIEAWLEIHKQIDLRSTSSPFVPLTRVGIGSDGIGNGYTNEPIAIIGMSCRYPGANSLEEFWKLLYEGEEAVQEPPAFRWTKEHSIRLSDNNKRTNAGFLSVKPEEFDARFFGVSPKEAAYMDPQTRLLHEVLWESLEDSGIDPTTLHGTHTGVFTGSWMNDYKDIVEASSDKDFFRTYMGNSIGAAAARLSFLLGLTGPSIATESGCSSAIVAVDLAVKSLRNGETSLALVGGVNLLLHPFSSRMMDHVLSPNGRCKTFDAKADGFGRAEGCGVLVLKRLSDALQNKDNIWAVIRGSAVSQEGLSRSLGTPTVYCEALAMKLALEDANVLPEQVSFVETHGTGTPVGDPMEVAAIARAYYSPNREKPLVIGSVKTNVGHTESCSGITGIMKTVLALHHELIPKHRNLEQLNPEIFLDSIPAIIPLEAVPWPKVKGQKRMAGVSSFGITGTDGHVIIEEAPEYQLPNFSLDMERPLHIMKFSGKTEQALDELLGKYEDLFSQRATLDDEDTDFGDAAFTGNVGRASFSYRAFIVANNFAGASKMLKEKQYLRAEVKEGASLRNQICFLFTGQGSQSPGMAKLLYETSPIFRVNFDACEKILRETYNISLIPVLWDNTTDHSSSRKQLSQTIYSQTSIFCMEYGLLKLWQSWGIQPDYVLGHSLGEFCAAVAADILDWKDALKLVAERSRLIDNLPSGSMLVVKGSKFEVENILGSEKLDLDIAAENSPEQTVVAGDTEIILRFLACLETRQIKATILEATHAFHSRHMDNVLERYREVVKSVQFKTGNGHTQYFSGMMGRMVSDFSQLCADEYWVNHTRERVLFKDACCALLQETGCQTFLEVGPQPTLSSFMALNCNGNTSLNLLPSLRRGMDDWRTILDSLGKLYLQGHKIHWIGFDEPYNRRKVKLPFHPFHRKSYWVEKASDGMNAPSEIHPLLGHSIANASALKIFQKDLALKSLPYLMDHCIGKRIVFPGAGFMEMCLSAGFTAAVSGQQDLVSGVQRRRAVKLENMKIYAPLELKEDTSCRLQVIVDLLGENAEGFRVRVYHQKHHLSESEKWVLHAASNFFPTATTVSVKRFWKCGRIQEILSSSEATIPDNFYRTVYETGLRFRNEFRMIKNYWTASNSEENMNEVVAQMEIPADSEKYLLHPLIIDAVFQSVYLTKYGHAEVKLKVPISIGQLTVLTGVPKQLDGTSVYVHAWFEDGRYSASISWKTNESAFVPIAVVNNIQLHESNVRAIESVLEQQNREIPDAWEETWKPTPGAFSTSVELVDVSKLLNHLHVDKNLQALREMSDENIKIYMQTKKLICSYILMALLDLGWKPVPGEKNNLGKICEKLGIRPEFEKLVHFYFTVLENETKTLQYDHRFDFWEICQMTPSYQNLKSDINSLCSSLKNSPACAVTEIYENLGENLCQILTGKIPALTLLFPSESIKEHLSASSFYQIHPAMSTYKDTSAQIFNPIFRLLHSHNSDGIYRVLEVGSGTGALTTLLLQGLQNSWSDRFELYFTDISTSFLVKAEKKFKEFEGRITYCIFDIEQSPLSQGIPLKYFDMVCASEVLHATKSLEQSLVHLRQTLRPGGVLLINETVTAALDITFVYGLLEGYWRFQDFNWRTNHCCVKLEVWQRLLAKTGFRHAQGYKLYADQFACIAAIAGNDAIADTVITSRRPEGLDPSHERKWVIFSELCMLEITWQLAHILNANSYKAVVLLKSSDEVNLANDFLMDLNEWISIKVIEAENENADQIDCVLGDALVEGIVYLWGMNESAERDQRNVALPFLHICKNIVGSDKPLQLLVVTQGVHLVGDDDAIKVNPTCATIIGMAKSLKNENPQLFVRCIDLEEGHLSPVTIVQMLLYEISTQKDRRTQNGVQVVYRNGVRFEPKLVKASTWANDQLKIPNSVDRFQLVLPDSKLVQDLTFDTLEEDAVEENDVEVKIKAYALNFRDIFAILKPSKQFEFINSVGIDFAGVVSKVGRSSKFRVGDRVFGGNQFKDAQLPTHLVLDSRSVLKIPDKITFWEVATLPTVFATAYYCLAIVAKMTKEDTVLIHTGSGGVGLAAIQLAKHVGAKIITTAGNRRKRAYLKSLGIEHVFHSRNTSYEQDILCVTDGKGVDIVLNSITGPGIKEATLRSCAKNARFVEMSKLSVWTSEEVKVLRPDVFYKIVDLGVISEVEWLKLLGVMNHFLEQGYLEPIPFVKFDALYLRQALQYFQQAKHIGKVVCTMPDVVKDEGQFIVSVPLFSSNSTYIITGGLGGIGFEVCKWMLERGASDVLLAGRSAPKPEIAAQIQRMNERGFNVKVKLGDVSNLESCKSVVKEAEMMGGKPLRGVMHCAGVLMDNLYPNQTWNSFDATFAPKVSGTWNLHEVTKHLPLEHFVVYSSVTALVGTPGQANHAAANCFEDAFIHYRHSLGLPGTSINWGQWSQVGCANEKNMTGLVPVSVERMLNGLEVALRTNKRQISFSEFDSFSNLSMLCPTVKTYLDEKLWKQEKSSDHAPSFSGTGQDLSSQVVWDEMENGDSLEQKSKVLTAHLKLILRASLRLQPDEPLDDHADIHELGVDSLVTIELRNGIQNLLGSRMHVGADLLKNCSTLNQISVTILEKLSGKGDAVTVDEGNLEPLSVAELRQLLSQDCVLDEKIDGRQTDISEATEPSKLGTVLVTGATGQLAPYLIAEMSKSYACSLRKVICLVKVGPDGTSDICAKEKVIATLWFLDLLEHVDTDKVDCIFGDVTKENLGLPLQTYNELAETVEAVFHCALNSDYSENYKMFEDESFKDVRSVNVGGTLNMLKFASRSKIKHFYFPSTLIGAFLGSNEHGRGLSEEWPDKDAIPVISNSNVPAVEISKFVCELLLQQANERGIPCKVYRFPWMAGELKSGQIGNPHKSLYLLRFLKFLDMNAMPVQNLPVNLLPVDLCAELSLKLFLTEEGTEVFNIFHPVLQMEHEFMNVAKNDFGKCLDMLDRIDFLKRESTGFDNIAFLREKQSEIRRMNDFMSDLWSLVSTANNLPGDFFKNGKASMFMTQCENIPTPMEIIRTNLTYLKSTGFI